MPTAPDRYAGRAQQAVVDALDRKRLVGQLDGHAVRAPLALGVGARLGAEQLQVPPGPLRVVEQQHPCFDGPVGQYALELLGVDQVDHQRVELGLGVAEDRLSA